MSTRTHTRAHVSDPPPPLPPLAPLASSLPHSDTAQRALAGAIGKAHPVFVVGNAPMAHMRLYGHGRGRSLVQPFLRHPLRALPRGSAGLECVHVVVVAAPHPAAAAGLGPVPACSQPARHLGRPMTQALVPCPSSTACTVLHACTLGDNGRRRAGTHMPARARLRSCQAGAGQRSSTTVHPPALPPPHPRPRPHATHSPPAVGPAALPHPCRHARPPQALCWSSSWPRWWTTHGPSGSPPRTAASPTSHGWVAERQEWQQSAGWMGGWAGLGMGGWVGGSGACLGLAWPGRSRPAGGGPHQLAARGCTRLGTEAPPRAR